MSYPGETTEYDWGNMKWYWGRYCTTKTLDEFLAATFDALPRRDAELIWQAFDMAAEEMRPLL